MAASTQRAADIHLFKLLQHLHLLHTTAGHKHATAQVNTHLHADSVHMIFAYLFGGSRALLVYHVGFGAYIILHS